MNNILIIGCGHMGSALLEAWSKNRSYNFYVIDPLRFKKINKKFKSKKIKSYRSIAEIKKTNSFDIVLVAITPQIANESLKEYKFLNFKKSCLLVSIVAGKKIVFFNKFFPNIKQIVRVMPNMPALVGEGVSCMISNNCVSKANKNKIQNLFSKIGLAIWLKSESDIDSATAISGSGPGYVFYIINAMENAANKLGLSKELNRKIIFQTFLGSLKLQKKTKQTAEKLSNTIAIKGGTTEAGLKIMKKKNLNKIFSETLLSAYSKARELGKK